jgi:hypothetical protein
MGSNFGDIDNDGYLDFYLGTGNPSFKSAVPNKLFKNMNGKSFLDVTSSARVGNIQKGHSVSFADLRRIRKFKLKSCFIFTTRFYFKKKIRKYSYKVFFNDAQTYCVLIFIYSSNLFLSAKT